MLFVEDPAAVKAHLSAALRGLDRLSPKDRELLEARRAFLELRLADALAHYDRVIAGWPQDPAGYVGAVVLTRYYGGAELARPHLEKVVELEGVDEMRAIDFLVELGRSDEALARARVWADRSPSPFSLRELAYVLGARGDARAALDARRRAMALDPPPLRPRWSDPWFFLEAEAEDEAEALFQASGGPPWSWLAVRGRRRAALAAYDAAAPPPSSPGRGVYHVARTDLTLGDGDPDRIWRDVVAALELGHFAANCARASLAYVGDLDRAARLDRGRDVGLPAEPPPRGGVRSPGSASATRRSGSWSGSCACGRARIRTCRSSPGRRRSGRGPPRRERRDPCHILLAAPTNHSGACEREETWR